MTDVLSLEDTGEIRIRPAATDPDAETQNLAGHMRAFLDLPGYRRPDATGELPVVAWGPTPIEPPPLPPIPQPSPNGPPKPAALERVADDTEVVSLLGALSGPRHAAPRRWRESEPTLWQRVTHRPKHRRESPMWGLAQLTVVVVAASALLLWAVR